MGLLIGIGIFLLVGWVIAIISTKTGFLGDLGNILQWIIKKIGFVLVIIVIALIAILVIGGLITFFS